MKPLDAGNCNPLCAKCLRSCKQPAAAVLVECPRFFPMPFKVERYRYSQLELFDKEPD